MGTIECLKRYPTVEAVIEAANDAELRRYQQAFEEWKIGSWADGMRCVSAQMFGVPMWATDYRGLALSYYAMRASEKDQYGQFKQEVYDMVLFELTERAAEDANHPSLEDSDV
jgi:hypothetical protein